MKRLINAIKDFFYETTDYAIILIVVIVIGIVLIWRFNILFNFDIAKKPIVGTEDLPQVTEVYPTESSSESTTTLNSESINYPVNIHIPSGSSAADIAELLLNTKLIADKNDFLSRAVELKLDTKLKSGDFVINSAVDLDELIKIIAKTN